MPDAALLATAAIASLAGMGWLALSLTPHWQQVRGRDRSPPVRALRLAGAIALFVALQLCLAADHPSMAVLVWIMTLAATALSVALMLAWRPRLLAGLVFWVRWF